MYCGLGVRDLEVGSQTATSDPDYVLKKLFFTLFFFLRFLGRRRQVRYLGTIYCFLSFKCTPYIKTFCFNTFLETVGKQQHCIVLCSIL